MRSRSCRALAGAALHWAVRATVFGAMFAGGLARAESPCPIVAQDIAPALAAAFEGAEIAATSGTDPDSAEPVRRTVVALPGGPLVIVDQKHCEIANLDVTLLDSVPLSDAETLALLAKALGVTPTWKENFSGTPEAALEGLEGSLMEVSLSLGERFGAVAKGLPEVSLYHDAGGLPQTGFRRVTSLYLGHVMT